MTVIGFVGLGQMGSRMAARLVDSEAQVLAFDVDQVALDTLVERGAQGAASVADVAAQATIVLCSLPRPEVVEDVLLGAKGLVSGGAVEIIVDLSTTGPTKLMSIADRLHKRGIDLVDAPVSGGVGGAEAGTLALMVSGNPVALERVDPILRVLGKNIFVMGDEPGLGQKMKLVNNMLCAANAVAAFEALAMGAKGGLDATRMLEVINTSSGRSFITTDKVPQCVLPRTFPPRFATDLLHKDMKLGIEEAKAIGAPLWMMDAAIRFIETAMAEGDPKADYATLIHYFERRAGVEVTGKIEEQNTS
jgi:3-hydroxyisobutyrate dehydrogenase